MKSIRRMNCEEMLEFMKKNRLMEFTYTDGIKISRNNHSGLNISFGDGEEMDYKFYMNLLEGLAQS
ncbi:hypothetical protein [Natronincola ferrireducens]|uniref:Uncharacterized protein n=1 Tax=Natronincola ferrireducens TaxID=393762 RepID=A0A1G9IGH7_9FIRM|nr:hypothetical protein [Natronincola ferrireducens]SDL23974.1 hypothetical protein SAMN05660472_02856 [Natronincola ferrireducens]